MGPVRTGSAVTIVRGEHELFRRVGHLVLSATDFACMPGNVARWASDAGDLAAAITRRTDPFRIRKLYSSGWVLDAAAAAELARRRDEHGAEIRVTTDELNETLVIDGRMAILAGQSTPDGREYSVITQPETVRGVSSLFETIWRSATDLHVYDAQVAEIRRLAPAVLDLLGQGAKDEAAARRLGMSVRTYRRRVGELMTALGADSRFQAGVRARELGLV